MARGRKKAETQDTGVQLGIEAELFKAADKLRGNMEPSDYKHVALGLIFLKYISDAFELKHSEILASEYPEDAEDRDMYTSRKHIFGFRRRPGVVPQGQCQASDHRYTHRRCHACY